MMNLYFKVRFNLLLPLIVSLFIYIGYYLDVLNAFVCLITN